MAQPQVLQQKWDLTGSMAPFMDVHMVGPLLDFLREVELYDPKVITKEKIKLLSKTNMVDLEEEEYIRHKDDASFAAEYEVQRPLLEKRRNEVFDRIDNEPEAVKLVTEFFSDADRISDLKAQANLTSEYLASHHGITTDALETYYKFSKFKYECGIYSEAEEMLVNYLSIVQPSSASVLGALWGRLVCRILQAKREDSLADLQAVKEAIDARNVSHVDQIRQRAWLLHWGLFVYMNQRDSHEMLADFFSEKHYLQTMENLCPWLLRYYTAAVVLSPSRRRTGIRDLLTEIQNMGYLYADPITQFLESLYTQFDFDAAQLKLKECQQLMRQDFFLQIFQDKFTHEARVLICEMYCTINRRVDLTMLSEKLQLTEEESERWMVDMVRGSSAVGGGAALDAKIDSSGKQVLMSPPSRTATQQVVERTRDFTHRSNMLASTVGGVLKDQTVFLRTQGGSKGRPTR